MARDDAGQLRNKECLVRKPNEAFDLHGLTFEEAITALLRIF